MKKFWNLVKKFFNLLFVEADAEISKLEDPIKQLKYNIKEIEKQVKLHKELIIETGSEVDMAEKNVTDLQEEISKTTRTLRNLPKDDTNSRTTTMAELISKEKSLEQAEKNLEILKKALADAEATQRVNETNLNISKDKLTQLKTVHNTSKVVDKIYTLTKGSGASAIDTEELEREIIKGGYKASRQQAEMQSDNYVSVETDYEIQERLAKFDKENEVIN